MNILISNDDGIYAKGIKVLEEYLRIAGHDTYVVAPMEEQSGTGHGVTLHTPLRLTKAYRNKNFFGYSVSGKPSDCIKVGFWEVFKDINFDFIISGINRGSNLGSDMLYSGTFSAAAEGALLGKRAIAISLVIDNQEKLHYETAAKFIVDYLEEVKNIQFPKDSLLNINVPNVKEEEIKGYKYTVQGDRRFKDDLIERIDPQGRIYYWLGGSAIEYEQNSDSDFVVVKENFISITPVNLNLSDKKFMNILKGDQL